MSAEKNKMIVLKGGITCQSENPHKKITSIKQRYPCAEWAIFNQSNPPLPLTKKMPEGDRIDNWIEVWQFKNNNNPNWETKNKNVYQNYDSFQAYTNSFGHKGFITRIAIEPIEVEKEEIPNVVESILNAPMVSILEIELALYEYWSSLENEPPTYHNILKIIQSVAFKSRMVKIQIITETVTVEGSVTREQADSEQFTFETPDYMIEITQTENGTWVSNAMDGHGRNQREFFKNSVVLLQS